MSSLLCTPLNPYLLDEVSMILAFQLLGELSELFHFGQSLSQDKYLVSINYYDGSWPKPSQSQFGWQECNA